jgi:uncharacterized protein (DUF427 family)
LASTARPAAEPRTQRSLSDAQVAATLVPWQGRSGHDEAATATRDGHPRRGATGSACAKPALATRRLGSRAILRRVSLTLGTAPLGNEPAGVFNRELVRDCLLYLEPSPRRIRGIAGGETVIDSRSARMLHEHVPLYLFPREEVRTDLLEPSETRTSSENKGEARWSHLRLGEERIEDAAWEWHEPPRGAPPLAGLLGFKWEALERWLEEDEEAVVHARDPYHRVDVLDSSRRVRITLDGELLADTDRGKVIFETGLPPRWYVPLDQVREELLIPSEKRTGCAYKGFASYWSVRIGDRVEEDLAWCYREPRRDVAPIVGMVAFFNERVDIELDGELQERPLTPWSPEWKDEPEDDVGPPVVRA